MSGIIYLRAQAQTHPFNVTNETSNSTKEAYHSDKREHHLSARTAGDVPAAHPQPFFRFVFGSAYIFIYLFLFSQPATCLRRIHKRKREEESSIPLSYLEGLFNLHEQWLIEKMTAYGAPNGKISKKSKSSMCLCIVNTLWN